MKSANHVLATQEKLLNGKMPNNKNCNNNHNSSEKILTDENKNEGDDGMKNGEVWQETQKVVKLFLERSLSQNAKSSMFYMKPEGYHKLKREGKLPYYQRQQSKPEQGNLHRKGTKSKVSFDGKSNSTLPSRPSLNELTSASKLNSFLEVTELEQNQYSSESDVNTIQEIEQRYPIDSNQASSRMIIHQLMESDANSGEGYFQSSDSLPSEDGSNHHLRRNSFTKAVNRKSVISYLEDKKKMKQVAIASKSSEEYALSSTDEYVSVQSKEKLTHSSHHRRKLSVTDSSNILSSQTQLDAKEEDNNPQILEKKSSMKEKWKRLMTGPSNKKKLKYKRTMEQRQGSHEQQKDIEAPFIPRLEEHPECYTAGSSGSVGRDVARHKSGQQHMPDRSPSPTKNKLLRSHSQKNKGSPKPQPRILHHSGSSASLTFAANNDIGGQLERNKSGSLPLSVRMGVRDYSTSSQKTRRFSEDTSFHYEVNAKQPMKKRYPTHDGSPTRPQHLDLHSKRNKRGKFKRFLRFWKRRHSSESLSDGSTHSQSLPSLCAPLNRENAFQDEEEQQRTEEIDSEFDQVDMIPSSSEEKYKPYHHRGSLSFSSGDLDGLSLPEKQKIYDDIAETLNRISLKFNRHIQSRSSTPGSKLTTPESSFSANEFRQQVKSSKSSSSGPPSHQPSTASTKRPVHSSGKSFRKYKDEKKPALAAYFNITSQGESRSRDSRKIASRMPRPLPLRRHTHHAQTGSFDSPYKLQMHGVRQEASLSSIPPVIVQEGGDVVDGVLPEDVDGSESLDKPSELLHDSRSSHTRSSSMELVEDITSEFKQNEGSDVDLLSTRQSEDLFAGRQVGDSRPSTSSMVSPAVGDGFGHQPSSEAIDEDKLVKELVEALCLKGDEYTRSIDMPNGVPMEPIIRSRVISYISRATYDGFQHFATRFCNNVKQLVETSPSRHPEIFPVVMALNMTRIMVDLVSSGATRQTLDQLVQYSTQFVSQLVQDTGNSWGQTFLEQLHDTEAELSEVESPEDSPRGTGNTDDELGELD